MMVNELTSAVGLGVVTSELIARNGVVLVLVVVAKKVNALAVYVPGPRTSGAFSSTLTRSPPVSTPVYVVSTVDPMIAAPAVVEKPRKQTAANQYVPRIFCSPKGSVARTLLTMRSVERWFFTARERS